MNKLQIIVIFISILSIFSCKKKNTASAPSSTNSGGIYANLSVSKSDTLRNGSITGTSYRASAAFSCSVNGYMDPATAIAVDTIKFNGVSMWYVSDIYYDTVSMGGYVTPPHPITYPYTFKVVSSSCISSFTYTENGPYPSYTGYSNIPDTVYKTSGLSFQLTGISNGSVVNINFDDGTSGSGHELGQQLSAPFPSSVNFSTASMSQFNTGNKARIQVQVLKFTTQSYGGKQMMFGTLYGLTKFISIK